MLFVLLSICCLLPLTSAQDCQSNMKRLAYYTRATIPSHLTPEKINSTLLTHIILSFLTVQNNQLALNDPSDVQRINDVVALKKQSPTLKVMVSIPSEVSSSAKKDDTRKIFANSVVSFLTQYNLDGIDIDWEFPGIFDKSNFVRLLKEVRTAINQQTRPLLLTAAVPAFLSLAKEGYDVKNINKYVDFVNIMTYDFHSYKWYNPFTGHNSPLFKRKSEILLWATMNIKWQAEWWVKHGMDKEKVLIGLPSYGYMWTLSNEKHHNLGSFATGGNTTYSYWQICSFLQNGFQRVFDDEIQAPYAYQGKNWLAYDDEQSFAAKTKWAKENGYGGVFTWSLNHDDWMQNCGGGKFPLHTTIYNNICA